MNPTAVMQTMYVYKDDRLGKLSGLPFPSGGDPLAHLSWTVFGYNPLSRSFNPASVMMFHHTPDHITRATQLLDTMMTMPPPTTQQSTHTLMAWKKMMRHIISNELVHPVVIAHAWVTNIGLANHIDEDSHGCKCLLGSLRAAEQDRISQPTPEPLEHQNSQQ